MAGKIVVPIKGDTVTNDEGNTFDVVSITRHKADPACYVKTHGNNVVYFSDIKAINDCLVEFDNTSKTFEALGKFKRKTGLPQEGDTIILKDGSEQEVNDIKFHNKSIGIAKGLVLLNKAKDVFTLEDIEDVKEKNETDTFNRTRFLKTYHEYLPFN